MVRIARRTGSSESAAESTQLPEIRGHAAAIVATLRGKEPLTLSEITTETGLSRPTMRGFVSRLVEQGWVREVDAQPASRGAGRPAARFQFAPRAGVVAGVDVGVHTVRVIVLDLAGDTIVEAEENLAADLSRDDRVDAVISAIESSLGGRDTPLLALGVGAPGVVGPDGRIITSPPLPDWDDLPLADLLSAKFGCRAIVTNDAMAAAEAEGFEGVARGIDDYVYLLAGRRITSAVVLDGRVRRGHTGIAGMIGEIEELAWHRAPEKLSAHGDSATLFEEAAEGRKDAARAIDSYLDDLAIGLAAIVLAVDPELVVVGGGISRAESAFADALREKIAIRTRIASPRVAVSTLDSRATAIGGAAAALSWVEWSILGQS